ncbi:hypothetical protein ASD74_06295 [Rhizobium sp. Root564]|nr:hypothetical protein ASD74_06295 [Rhizobium sp. Root564]
MTDTLTNEEMVAHCNEMFDRIGKAFGRIIFGRAVMLQIPPDEVEEGINAAVEDSRDYFKEGGLCDHDADLACRQIKLAIVLEGQRIISALPDEIGGIH